MTRTGETRQPACGGCADHAVARVGALTRLAVDLPKHTPVPMSDPCGPCTWPALALPVPPPRIISHPSPPPASFSICHNSSCRLDNPTSWPPILTQILASAPNTTRIPCSLPCFTALPSHRAVCKTRPCIPHQKHPRIPPRHPLATPGSYPQSQRQAGSPSHHAAVPTHLPEPLSFPLPTLRPPPHPLDTSLHAARSPSP